MFLSRLKCVAAALLALGVTAAGAGLLSFQALAQERSAEPPAQARAAAPKAEGTVLRWKLEKGKPFYQEMTTETDQAMKVAGGDVKQSQRMTFHTRWTPEGRDTDGNWVVAQKIEGLKLTVTMGGEEIRYDSTRRDGKDGLGAEWFKALVGAEFRHTLTPDLTVVRSGGRDELVKKFAAAAPQSAGMLEHVLGEESLREGAETAFAFVPDRALRRGDSWDRDRRIGMGPVGSFDSRFRYTFEGREGPLAVVGVEGTLRYRAPAAPAAGMPFQIESADLKEGHGTGVLLFDVAKGRVALSHFTQRLEGTLTIVVGGQKQQVALAQTQKVTLRTTDVSAAGPPEGEAAEELRRLTQEQENLRRQLRRLEEEVKRLRQRIDDK